MCNAITANLSEAKVAEKGLGYIEVDDIFVALGLADAAELRAQTLLASKCASASAR